MSEQLTQEEIDALRNAVKTGAVENIPKKPADAPSTDLKVVSYDFRKPKLLSAERMLALQLMHQTLAKDLQGLLFSMFKISGQSSLEALEQVTYGEYALSVNAPSCLLGLTISPVEGSVEVELSPPLSQILLDLLLGGDGEDVAQEDPRELTEVEFEILKVFNSRMNEELDAIWSQLCDLTFSINSHGISTDQVQVASPDTPCLLAIILLRLEDQETRLQICYPFSVLQAIFDRAEASREDQTGKRTERRKNMLRALHPAPLSLEVELGRAKITARELNSLSVGDIIKLDHSIEDPFAVTSCARPLGMAYVGSHRGRTAACINRIHSIKKKTPDATPSGKQ
jgi:flagellar motor switch protein FliM